MPSERYDYPDPGEVDRRLSLKMRLWVGAGAAILGAITLIANLIVSQRISISSLIGIVVGVPLSVFAWRELRRAREKNAITPPE